jgi:hypothetical protein
MPTYPKPDLHLPATTGDSDEDLEMLADLYEKLTGRRPTPEELAEAAVELKKQPTPEG